MRRRGWCVPLLRPARRPGLSAAGRPAFPAGTAVNGAAHAARLSAKGRYGRFALETNGRLEPDDLTAPVGPGDLSPAGPRGTGERILPR